MKCSICRQPSYGTFPVPSSDSYLSDCRSIDGQDHVVRELCFHHAIELGHLGTISMQDDNLKNRQDNFRDFMQQGMDRPITPQEKYEFDNAVAKTNPLPKITFPFPGGQPALSGVPEEPRLTERKIRFRKYMMQGSINKVLTDEEQGRWDQAVERSYQEAVKREASGKIALDQTVEALKHIESPGEYTMGVDWGKTARKVDKLTKTLQKMDEAVVAATQSVEGLREASPPDELSPSELIEATLIEDHIEKELDKYPGKGWMTISVIDSDPDGENLCRVGEYIRGRFYGWDIRYVPGDPVWEFRAR